MVAHKNERKVFLLRLQPRPLPIKSAKEVTLEEIIQILQSAHEANVARCHLSEGGRLFMDDGEVTKSEKNQIYIAAIKKGTDGKTITFLFNRGDPNAALPAFLDTAENAVEVLEPADNQTQGYSAHLVISLNKDSKGHKACLEKMHNVSSSLVFAAIDRLLAKATEGNKKYRYEEKEKNGEKKTKRYRPKIDVTRVPSEKLQQDLEQGQLTGIVLTKKTANYAGPGAKEIIKSQAEKIFIKTRPAAASSAAAMVKGLVSWGKKEGYTNITFELDNLPGDQSNHPTLSIDDHDALEQLYSRAQVVDGLGDLPTCHEKVCQEIEQKMIEVLHDKVLWSKAK